MWSCGSGQLAFVCAWSSWWSNEHLPCRPQLAELRRPILHQYSSSKFPSHILDVGVPCRWRIQHAVHKLAVILPPILVNRVYLAGVNVGQVKRIFWESDTTTGGSLNKVRVLVACTSKSSISISINSCPNSSISQFQFHIPALPLEVGKLTGNLPDQVRRHLGRVVRHLCCMLICDVQLFNSTLRIYEI